MLGVLPGWKLVTGRTTGQTEQREVPLYDFRVGIYPGFLISPVRVQQKPTWRGTMSSSITAYRQLLRSAGQGRLTRKWSISCASWLFAALSTRTHLCAAFKGDSIVLAAARQEVRSKFEVRAKIDSGSCLGCSAKLVCSMLASKTAVEVEHLCIFSMMSGEF